MGRKLRIKRVVGTVLILLALIGVTWLTVYTLKRRGSSAGEGTAITQGQSDSGSIQGSVASGHGNVWPMQLFDYVSEYKGAGELISATSEPNSEGKAVYIVRYSGATIDSSFAYAKEIGITGEWTEVVTDEEYTINGETDRYIVDLTCLPKGQNGYTLEIKVRIK